MGVREQTGGRRAIPGLEPVLVQRRPEAVGETPRIPTGTSDTARLPRRKRPGSGRRRHGEMGGHRGILDRKDAALPGNQGLLEWY